MCLLIRLVFVPINNIGRFSLASHGLGTDCVQYFVCPGKMIIKNIVCFTRDFIVSTFLFCAGNKTKTFLLLTWDFNITGEMWVDYQVHSFL